MSEFNIEDLDAVIAQGREGSLAQMLALQLKSQIRKGEQMAKEREAFAVECAAAKIALKYTLSGRRDFILATPETDTFLAGIKADGVEEFIGRLQQCVDDGDFVGDEVAVIVGAIDCGKEFCEQQRKGADK